MTTCEEKILERLVEAQEKSAGALKMARAKVARETSNTDNAMVLELQRPV